MRIPLRAFLSVLLIACLGWTSLACSQTDRTPRTRVFRFDIAAQPLDTALARVSQVSGVQMLFDSSLATGRRSAPISGDYTVQEALVRLLVGTGLRARFTVGGSIIVTMAERADMTLDMLNVRAAPVIGDPAHDPAALAYAALVQREIVDALKLDKQLSEGDYRISVRLWLDPHGQVTRSDVISSSGEIQRDHDFAVAVQTMQISQSPPENMPQPLRIEFRVH